MIKIETHVLIELYSLSIKLNKLLHTNHLKPKHTFKSAFLRLSIGNLSYHQVMLISSTL